jgi:cytochrome c
MLRIVGRGIPRTAPITLRAVKEVRMRMFPIALALALFAGGTDLAHADQELLQKNNCFACHSIDKRKYGPKFVDIAAKYANDSGAAASLAKKIKSGSSGVWGEDQMPPQPQVSDADALALAKYVLSLK